MFRLTFLLPRTMLLRVPEGRHSPCLHGIVLIVDRGVVTIDGPSRERCFDQARRLFRVHAKGLPALNVSALLETPSRTARGGPDVLTISINSDVTFTFGPGVEPYVESPPKLELVS